MKDKWRFDAGMPLSCWLKEEILGEMANKENGFGSELVDKYNPERDFDIFTVKCLDDYPPRLRAMAEAIIESRL